VFGPVRLFACSQPFRALFVRTMSQHHHIPNFERAVNVFFMDYNSPIDHMARAYFCDCGMVGIIRSKSGLRGYVMFCGLEIERQPARTDPWNPVCMLCTLEAGSPTPEVKAEVYELWQSSISV